MLSGLMGPAGAGKDLKPPGSYKNREQVIEALKVAQPELINPQSIVQKLVVVAQFYSMGVFEPQDQRKFALLARSATFGVGAGVGLALLGWRLTNQVLQSVPRRSRVIGRTFISFLAFSVPLILMQQHQDKIISGMQKDYTDKYIDFMLTNDISKLSSKLAAETKKGQPPA